MRFVSIRELRHQPASSLRTAGAGELVVTNNGKPVAVLVGVEEGDLEETLIAIRRARTAAVVSRLRRSAARSESASLSPDEIDAEIQAVRGARGHG